MAEREVPEVTAAHMEAAARVLSPGATNPLDRRIALAIAYAEKRGERRAESASDKAGWIPQLVTLCDWLAGCGFADAATHILCNYNDPDNPGDGTCRALHECLPPPPASEK